MIKVEETMRDEIFIMQDNLNAIKCEFMRDEAYEGYIDEKLSHIEQCCKYFRALVESEKQ